MTCYGQNGGKATTTTYPSRFMSALGNGFETDERVFYKGESAGSHVAIGIITIILPDKHV